MGAGKRNLEHVLHGTCTDPDCELHSPSVIEDEDERLTAIAWVLVGAECALDLIIEAPADHSRRYIRREILKAAGVID